MNLVFASDSIFTWEIEKNFAILKAENPELVQAARRGNSITDSEMALPAGTEKRPSLVQRHYAKASTKSVSDDEKASY